jgi:hypothetical protein
VTRTRCLGSLRTVICLALAAACGDDDSTGTNDRSRDGATLSSRDGGLDASRDGSSLDAKTNADSATTVIVDGGEAGVITFVRTDGCPADAPLPINRVRIATRDGGGSKLIGAKLQGSNEATTSGFVDLAVIDAAPEDGQFAEYEFENETTYRYIRLFDPEGRDAHIAELEFFHGPVKLTGRAYGTAPGSGSDNPFENAFDGDVQTYFTGSTPGGNYLGYDIAGTYVSATPTFTPPAGALSGPTEVALASATPNATISYTTDGSAPDAATAQAYAAPIQLETGRLSIRALANAPCHFPSAVASASYGIGAEPVGVGQKSYHVGNSLTDQLNFWLEPSADSTGVDHTYARCTIPGTPVGYLWDHRNGDCTSTPEAAANFDAFVRSYAPIDHFSVQPFSNPELSSQGAAGVNFFKAVQADSPNVQPWIYAQWPSAIATAGEGESRGYLQDELARGAEWAGWPAPATPVPNTWEDTADAQLRYHEAYADYVDERIPGKKVLVCPTGSALAQLKRRVDAGTFPGITDFFETIFFDDLHLNDPGGYLVSLVFYSCIYRQNPEGRVTAKPDSVTQEQAIELQRIAWQVASGYARSGIIEQ